MGFSLILKIFHFQPAEMLTSSRTNSSKHASRKALLQISSATKLTQTHIPKPNKVKQLLKPVCLQYSLSLLTILFHSWSSNLSSIVDHKDSLHESKPIHEYGMPRKKKKKIYLLRAPIFFFSPQLKHK